MNEEQELINMREKRWKEAEERESGEMLKYCSYHTKHLITVPQCYLKMSDDENGYYYERVLAIACIEMRDERKKGTNEYTMEWLKYITHMDLEQGYEHDDAAFQGELIYSHKDLTKCNMPQKLKKVKDYGF